MKRVLISFGVVLLIFNIPPFKSFMEAFAFSRSYYYTTLDHRFNDKEMAFKELTYDIVMRSFNHYKENCGKQDAVLYRTFPVVPWKFWLWGEFIFHPKYRLHYIKMPVDYHYNLLIPPCK
jgi:hypothetical protein